MHTNLIDLIRPQMQMQIYQILPRIFYNYKMVKQFVSLKPDVYWRRSGRNQQHENQHLFLNYN